MREDCVLVLDVGKTNAKLSVWTRAGRHLASAQRANTDVQADGYRALDTQGVCDWLAHAIKPLAAQHNIGAIVPIAHGAAAALLSRGRLAAAPMSYEHALPQSAAYESGRDAFEETGSPRLPNGLNLGAQLQHLSVLRPDLFSADAQLVPYPQYWAWLLSGVASAEVSSLGCHSDLWRPAAARYSNLAERLGMAQRFAPLRQASEVLGPITKDWAEATGLPRHCVVYCGAHDSNAAFFGALSHPTLAGRDVTILSTGTWFVAMRAPKGEGIGPADLSAERDTLINVGVDGRLVPSARFMGGREMEALIGAEDTPMRTPEFAREVAPRHVPEIIESGVMVLPSFARGVGPFPTAQGHWSGAEMQGAPRRAAAGVYLALLAETSLGLIGSRDAIVVEGRFADDLSFLRVLATLRPDCDIYASRAEDGIASGALRLVDASFKPDIALTKVGPIDVDVSAYAARWRALATGGRT